MPENLRTDVPERRKAAYLIQAAFNNVFPTLPAREMATDGRDHRVEGKICEVEETKLKASHEPLR